MIKYLYEKDLRRMKLLILESRRHDAVVKEIATILGIKRQLTRKILIERCDMILLENLPARCDAARKHGDELSRSLGIPLFSQALQLITEEEGDHIIEMTMTKIQSGTDKDTAIQQAQSEILGLIRK